ncbi:MAG: SpoIIE family protein phosphatase [Candidatus Baltobacteraceae bacterium]
MLDELRAAEARYRLIAEAMPQFVWVDAPDGSAIYANRRWLDYIGLTAEENAGFGWTLSVHPDDAARLDPVRKKTLRTGEDFESECRYKGKDGKYRWYLFRSIAVRGDEGEITSWVGTATDIDRQKRAEEQQKFFATASELLGSTLDERTTLERIAQLCVPGLADWCIIDLLGHPDSSLTTTLVEHSDPEKREKLQRLLGPTHFEAVTGFGAPHVIDTGEPQIFPFIEPWMVEAALPAYTDRLLFTESGYSSAMILPLKCGETVYGALTLLSADPARLYNDFDLTSAMEFARRGGIAIEHSRLFAREHMVATTLQRALLPPKLPQMGNVHFSSAYAAAVKGEEVGGDWYDAFELPNGRIALSIGDVAGHGLEAAVTMGTVRQAIRTAALERSQPGDVLSRANSALSLDKRDTMVTAIFATFEPASRVLEYAIAGHPRPLVVDTRGHVQTLEGSGPPLGALYDTQRVELLRVTLPTGSSVVFFTDGLTEFDRDIARAEKRLTEMLESRRHSIAENPARAIIDTVLYAPQRDDIAVLVMTLEDQAEQVDILLPATPRSAPVARNALRAFARFHALDENRTFSALAAAGEAVANAIEHAYDNGEGIFMLRAAVTRGQVNLEVTDHGKWGSGNSVDRGRGLTIMKAMAKFVDVERTAAGTTVHLTL